MISQVRSVMVVFLFGGGGSVNVSGSSWCTVTVSSKPNNALFGEDMCLRSKIHDNRFLSSFLSFFGPEEKTRLLVT